MHQSRPSDRELVKKIEEAKFALKTHEGLFANPAKAVGERYTLHIGDSSEMWELIRQLLQEITPKDYSGAER